jgi:spermidine synthase
MAIPWQTLDRTDTKDGVLELRSRGERDFLITIAGRILMNSHANRSELVLAREVCKRLEGVEAPHVLIGGLGMGCTLRATLDGLAADARVTLAEQTPNIKARCEGPLAGVNGDALSDPRAEVVIQDVSKWIRKHADDIARPRLHAIILDLYEGPHARTHARRDPFYGTAALDATRRALVVGGTFAIWSEAPDEAFEKRIKSIGFGLELKRAGKGGRSHAVYIAQRKR